MTGEQHTANQDPVALLRELAVQWSSAGDRAFATGLTDPATYARTTRLVGAATQALRSLGDRAEDLLAAWPGRLELITTVVTSDDSLTTEGVDLEAVAGAAFAMRHREVAASTARARRLETLANHDGGSTWAVLEESGPYDGDPFIPYRRLEVAPDLGRAILVTTRPNEAFSGAVHLVEELRFNTVSGELGPPVDCDEDGGPLEFNTSMEREHRVALLRNDPDPPLR